MAKKSKTIIVATRSRGLDGLVGQAVFVRAVTHYYTGRFAAALGTGALNEVEPYPGRCYVSRGAVVDVSAWSHPLPRGTK